MDQKKGGDIKKKHFLTSKLVSFGEADPAGIHFFANVFRWSHEAFEEFLVNSALGWKNWFENSEWVAPIRHCTADFQRPLFPGRQYKIEVQTGAFGSSSFTSFFRIRESNFMAQNPTIGRSDEPPCVEVRMVHVFLEKIPATNSKIPKKIPIPINVLNVLRSIEREESNL